MSALAARRAAKAALATSPSSVGPTTRAASKPKPKSPSPSPEPELTPSPSFSDVSLPSEHSAPSKRRRVDKGGKKEANKVEKGGNGDSSRQSRYYFAPEEVTETDEPTSKAAKRRRRWSPGAPIGSDDGNSDDGSSGDEEENVQEEMGATWSGAATPRAEAGPSRSHNSATLGPSTSRFVPLEGINLIHVDAVAISKADIKTAGPGVVISLGPDDTLQLAGAFTVTPLRGSISLLSSFIHPSAESVESYPVFAPVSHPVPVLTVAEGEAAESPALSSFRLPRKFYLDPSHVVFVIQENLTGIESLTGDVVPGFSNIWLSDQGSWGLRGVHPTFSFSTPVYAHCTPPSWSNALASLSESSTPEVDEDSPAPDDNVPVVLVKGPKRSGKSSLARASLNRLLDAFARVAWLECDLGQGEFGCGGVVGLWVIERPVFGPPFTHPRLPARAHYLGELSPQSCPDAYMAAVQSLLTHYQYEVQYTPGHVGHFSSTGDGSSWRRHDAVPLVVNTQGWVKGLGEDLMRAIEAAAEPTHVFAFETEESVPTAAAGAGWTTSPVQHTSELPFASPWDAPAARLARSAPQVFSLEPAPVSPLQARYTAADMRALSTVAYMNARLGGEVQWDFSTPLFAVHPWVVRLGPGSPLSRAFLLGEGADAVVPSDLALALNGSLVALLEDSTPPEDDEVYVPGRAVPETASFMGLALVRAVRVDDGVAAPGIQLQLLTPLGASELARASAIAWNGALELPSCAMLDWRVRGGVSEDGLAGVRWDDVPFFDAAGSGAVGGDKRRFRRNLQRKGM